MKWRITWKSWLNSARDRTLYRNRLHMNRIEEIQREIESVRSELNESFLQNDEFEEYYRKSTELDKLIEEYLERKQQVQMS